MEEDTFKQPGFPMQEGTQEHEDATALKEGMDIMGMVGGLMGGGKKEEETTESVEPDHKGSLSI